jgi:Arc/MetJ family transcription regulator
MSDPAEAPMTDVVIRPDVQELDAELLAEAQRHLSATPSAVINEALRRLVAEERQRRRAAGEAAQQMAADGLLDFSRLEEIDE